MPRRTRQMSLRPDADHILAGVGNASEYVSNVVAQHDGEWREALHLLRESRWSRDQILAACDALNNPLPMLGQSLAASLALELHDGEALNQTASGQWGVGPRTWRRRVKAIGESEILARALWVVAREFWHHNAALETAIRRR